MTRDQVIHLASLMDNLYELLDGSIQHDMQFDGITLHVGGEFVGSIYDAGGYFEYNPRAAIDG